jgi:hypothetical protein
MFTNKHKEWPLDVDAPRCTCCVFTLSIDLFLSEYFLSVAYNWWWFRRGKSVRVVEKANSRRGPETDVIRQLIFLFCKMATPTPSVYEIRIAELKQENTRLYGELDQIDAEISRIKRDTLERANAYMDKMDILVENGRTDSVEYRHYKERRAELCDFQHQLELRKTPVCLHMKRIDENKDEIAKLESKASAPREQSRNSDMWNNVTLQARGVGYFVTRLALSLFTSPPPSDASFSKTQSSPSPSLSSHSCPRNSIPLCENISMDIERDQTERTSNVQPKQRQSRSRSQDSGVESTPPLPRQKETHGSSHPTTQSELQPIQISDGSIRMRLPRHAGDSLDC